MNENPGETPNPLNPSPEGTDNPVSEPDSVPAPAPEPTPAPVSEPAPSTEPTPAPEAAPISEPTSEPAVPTDPMNRPMEQAAKEEIKPVKKSKKGIIIGIIVCLFIAVACAVAAILLTLNSGDPVAKAFDKIISGEFPGKITANGTIDVVIDEQDVPFSNLKLSLNTNAMTDSAINSTAATLTGTMKDGSEDVSVNINEIYTPNGDFYFQLGGVENAIKSIITRQSLLTSDSELETETVLDCVASETEDCTSITTGNDDEYAYMYLDYISSIVKLFDEKWIRISTDQISEYTKSLNNDTLECSKSALKDLKNSSNTIKKIYQDHPFITSTNKDIVVASKLNPVYKIELDGEEFAGFIKAFYDTDIVKNFYSCEKTTKPELSSTDEIIDAIQKLPSLYVEIDNNFNFSRLYFKTTIGNYDTTVDFDFTYPSNIDVAEPTEYQDFQTVIQNVSQQFNSGF